MTAKEQYVSKVEYINNCTCISESRWDKQMENSKKANGSIIRKMIKTQIPDLYNELALEFPNPYEHQSVRNDDFLVYVHSAIEYFLKIK